MKPLDRTRVKLALAAAAIALLVISAPRVSGQTSAQPGNGSQDNPSPNNALPNPYRTIADWATLPAGRAWGSVPGVSVDRNDNVWVFERCGANTCAGSDLAPILEFDSSGKFLKGIGAGLFIYPHGLTVDRDGNIWATDSQSMNGKGQQVWKLSPAGKVLMTLGTAGVAGDGPNNFNMPSAVAIAPNGDIFIADGHGGDSNARIVKFSKEGKFLMTWGKKGAAPGEFDTPHSLAFDSKGRLFVADRGNSRLQIFDQQGKFLGQWKQFSRPSGVAFGKDDTLYVSDTESGSVAMDHAAWKRGVRIGSAKEGSVNSFIPDPVDKSTTTSGPESLAIDSHGALYGAEGAQKHLKKYVRQ